MKMIAASLLVAVALCGAAGHISAADLERLAGTWSVEKTNEEGQKYKQVLKIDGDAFTFRVVGGDGSPSLYAEGKMELKKAGPFSMVRFHEIRAGGSQSDLQPADEDYSAIYRLEYDTWSLAVNFDRYRDDQQPSVDVYKRVRE
jgi:hypothetical protein